MTIEAGSPEIAIIRPFRRLKVSYVRKRHEDPKPATRAAIAGMRR